MPSKPCRSMPRPMGADDRRIVVSQSAQHERALGELRAALDLNPSFALGRMVFGWASSRAGHFDAAVTETGRGGAHEPA